MNRITTAQIDNADKGKLQINVTSDINSYPISEAKISITYTGVPGSPIEELTTDSSGQTEVLELDTPPLEYSLNPTIEYQPYSEYTLNVSAPGFEPLSIAGAEILPDVTAIQNITMHPMTDPEPPEDVFVIPAHTLYGEYPPKIPEDEIKPLQETGEIVLSRVVVPEYIVVHTALRETALPKTTMSNIKIISKMWHPAKFMPHGHRILSVQMCSRLCHLH